MPNTSKITTSDLPRSGSAKPSTNRITFAQPVRGDDASANNAVILPSGAPRCYTYKKDSNIRCSQPAYPGSRFCSQDHENWDKKANGTTHRVYTAADTDEELAPPDTSEEHDRAPNLESSHSRENPFSTAQESLGPLQGFAAVVAETTDLTKPSMAA